MITHRDPVCLGPRQIGLVLGVRGQELHKQHGGQCADGVAQGLQVLKLKVLQERLSTTSAGLRETQLACSCVLASCEQAYMLW